MGVTIKDVAREAGVAVSTVSRVLNNSGYTSPETHKRITEVANRLGYVPNSSARSLITQKTFMIGVILPDLFGEFYSEVIRGIDQTLQHHNYRLLLSSSHNNNAEIAATLKAMHGSVDGLIVMFPEMEAKPLKETLPGDLPTVMLNCVVHEKRFDSVTIDNYKGAYLLVKHLIDCGHDRIAIITGGESNRDAMERLEGYRDAIRDAKLTYMKAFAGGFTQLSGYDAAKTLLKENKRPSAVFASNDTMAVGVMRAFREEGLEVPRDIAVGGFDDIPIVQYLNPPLTTVRFPIREMGERAVLCLIRAIEKGRDVERSHMVLPVELVVRESCGYTVNK